MVEMITKSQTNPDELARVFRIFGIDPMELHEKLEKQEEIICALLLEAVHSHDRDKIIEIADAVWKLRDFRLHGFSSPGSQDTERTGLLVLKEIALKANAEVTKPCLAKLLGYTDKQIKEMAADGFSALTKKCRELDFPLAKSRQIRKK